MTSIHYSIKKLADERLVREFMQENPLNITLSDKCLKTRNSLRNITFDIPERTQWNDESKSLNTFDETWYTD